MAEQDMQMPQEVVEWAESFEKRRLKRIIDNEEISGEDFQLRIYRGDPYQEPEPSLLDAIERGSREIGYLEKEVEKKLASAKAQYVRNTAEAGVVGVHNPDANINVNAVNQRAVLFDDEKIKELLSEEQKAQVYFDQTAISLKFEGGVPIDDGSLSSEKVFLAIRHALLGVGVSEQWVNERLRYVTEEVRRNEELARIIREGGYVGGVTVEFSSRVEVDDIKKHEATRIIRPRKRNDLYEDSE